MLSPPNEALVARDAALPGLGCCSTREALAAALGTSAVTLRHLRYKPGTSCSRRRDGGRALAAAARPDPARITPKRAMPDGVPGALCLAVATPRRETGRARPARGSGPRTRRGKVAGRSLRRKPPGRGAAGAPVLPAGAQARRAARPSAWRGAPETARAARFAQAQAGALWGAFLGHGARWSGPAPSRRFAVATRWQPGATLTAGTPPTVSPRRVRRSRECMTPPSPALPRSRAEEIAAVARTLTDAGHPAARRGGGSQACPRLAGALAATPADPGPIHGDFSADQVVIARRRSLPDRLGPRRHRRPGGRPRLGARAARGRPALGRVPAERRRGRAGAAGRLRRAAPFPPRSRTQRLAHLALLLCEPFRRQLPWTGPAAMADLIERASSRASTASTRPGRPIRRCPSWPRSAIRAGAQALLDARGGAPRRAAASGAAQGRAARAGRITSETDAGPRRWLAKTRSKRPDHASPGLHRALRAAGFDGAPARPSACRRRSRGRRACGPS
jgi:hypothetical protein